MNKNLRRRRIVLGHPFDGAFIWFINKDLMRHDDGGGFYNGSHSYYQTLYGEKHGIIAPKIVSLSILYDDIFIASADIGLPDSNSFLHGDDYFNPLIGLHHSWGEYRRHQNTLDELVSEDLHDPNIYRLLPKGEQWRQKLIMERINLQIILALQHDAKILAGPVARQIIDIKIHKASQSNLTIPVELEELRKVNVLDKYFDFACFEFKAPRYDDLVALKQDHLVQEYSKHFNKIMDDILISENPYDSFVKLMNKSMIRKDLAKNIRSGFSGSGRFCTWVGLIPIAGNIASAFGAGSDVGTQAAIKAELHNAWYLLGPRMSEVILDSRLTIPRVEEDPS